MARRRYADWKLRRTVLTPIPSFQVHFSKTSLASDLWFFGEDALAERAYQMPDSELRPIQTIASHYEDPNYPLPVSGQNISHGHVAAFAAITYFEGAVRPLARTRRRPSKDRPARYTPLPPDPLTGL